MTVCRKINFIGAFSLVEMLMALLVASLLMVALAPVITKKFSENLNISSIGGTRADYKRTWYYDPAKEYHEWTVPNGVNVIKVTSIGGGGAGGGASLGSKVFTTTQNWTVPDGVTKLRVFMTGGGGAGATSEQSSTWAYEDIPAISSADGAIKTPGGHTFVDMPTPSSYVAPALNPACASSKPNNKWTIISSGATIEPGIKFSKFLDETKITLTKVTACGAGGGAGGWTTIPGGSGGYIHDVALNSTASASNILLVPGYSGADGVISYKCVVDGITYTDAYGGGGGAGFAGLNGTVGGTGWNRCTMYPCTGSGGGGGGGGATGGSISGTTIFQISGGGGSGGAVHGNKGAAGTFGRGGNGGKGGGTSPGLGGGGAVMDNGARTIGTGATSAVAAANGIDTQIHNTEGGGGGGGIGGVGGGKGTLDTIFGANNCNSGKPGAIHLWYSAARITNGLKCEYYIKTNGSGGGGAGQVWFGEVTVNPGDTITMTVGKGGTPSSLYGKDGGDGGATSVNGIVTVNGGKGGTYKKEDENISFSAGAGGKYLDTNLKNWIAISDTDFNALKSLMGLNGNPGTIVSDGSTGGAGGNTIDRFGQTVYGGDAGNVQNKGGDAKGYGAGGGGGGGVQDNGALPGLGGNGGAGYIYIEWGGTNGGGGASGQVITQESVWVTPGTIVKIYPGKGGVAPVLTVQNDSSGTEQGKKGENGPDGGDTYLMVKDSSAEKKAGIAKGGKGGFGGGATHGRGGGIKTDASGNYDPNNIISEIENSTPGETAADEHGGMGGTITEEMCPLLTELKKVGLGGCGGNTTTAGTCQTAIGGSGEGVNAGGIGNGGGGGAVVETAGVKTPYKGGNGSGGMVTIEWSN